MSNSCVVSWVLRRAGLYFKFTHPRPRVSQVALNVLCERVLATEHAQRGPFQVLERRDGFAQILERGGRVAPRRRRARATTSRAPSRAVSRRNFGPPRRRPRTAKKASSGACEMSTQPSSETSRTRSRAARE